ncbi:MAG: hypothetical protein AAGC92_01335 [Pseudomonadota bacterium]
MADRTGSRVFAPACANPVLHRVFEVFGPFEAAEAAEAAEAVFAFCALGTRRRARPAANRTLPGLRGARSQAPIRMKAKPECQTVSRRDSGASAWLAAAPKTG